ncbi:hypothetical protein G9A89_004942 [Geosiphon pyriformis]|nr:hypothetical protein G9A89_004942 [Geosiphon pyriformis]
MSSTSSIENATSLLDWLEGALIVIKEHLAIIPVSECSKVANFKAANAEDSFRQLFLGRCYNHGLGTSQDRGKAFELYSKATMGGNTNAQLNLRLYSEKAFELYSKVAEAGHANVQYNLGNCYQYGWGTTKNEGKEFELYSKAAEAGMDQNNLEYNLLRFQNRGFKYPDNLQGEFLNFEAFFDQLSDEFKCFKCDNLSIIINGSAICPFCDTDKTDDTFKAGLPKYLECYRALKDPLWCESCESSRFSRIWDTWKSGNENIDQYILYTQRNSENCRGCLELIFPDEIIYLDKVGEGGFGIVGGREAEFYFRDKKNQKHEGSGVTKFIPHLRSASCKYILECYGITKDVTTNEFVMVLPFAEHGDLRAFLKMNKDTFTWDMFLRILFQIVSGLRFMHDSELVHGDMHPGNILVSKSNPLKVAIADLGFCSPANFSTQPNEIFGVVEYSAPEVCNLSSHTKYSDIYSCANISWEIISGERPWNDVKNFMYIQIDIVQGKHPIIEKRTPQCIQEMIEKNWDQNLYCRDTAEELQQKVICCS